MSSWIVFYTNCTYEIIKAKTPAEVCEKCKPKVIWFMESADAAPSEATIKDILKGLNNPEKEAKLESFGLVKCIAEMKKERDKLFGDNMTYIRGVPSHRFYGT